MTLPKRLINAAICKRIALCKQGKNGLRTLFKAKGKEELTTLSKGDMEKGELLTVLALPDWVDDDGDEFASEEVLREFAHSIITNMEGIDIEHEGEVLPDDAVRLTEVFMIQPTDTRFAEWPTYEGDTVDARGGVAAQFQIDSPTLREAYRSGDWDGVSLFGPAAVEELELKAASKRVAARMGGSIDKEIDMTKEELEALLAAERAKTTELVKSAVAEAVAEAKSESTKEGEGEGADSEPKAQKPVFTGDASNPADLEAYAAELRKFEINEKIASGELTAEEVGELAKSASAGEPSNDELREAGIDLGDAPSAKERELAVKLFKARKSSRAPERKGASKESEDAELAKAVEDEAQAIAAIANEFMGNGASTQGMRVVQG